MLVRPAAVNIFFPVWINASRPWLVQAGHECEFASQDYCQSNMIFVIFAPRKRLMG